MEKLVFEPVPDSFFTEEMVASYRIEHTHHFSLKYEIYRFQSDDLWSGKVTISWMDTKENLQSLSLQIYEPGIALTPTANTEELINSIQAFHAERGRPELERAYKEYTEGGDSE